MSIGYGIIRMLAANRPRPIPSNQTGLSDLDWAAISMPPRCGLLR